MEDMCVVSKRMPMSRWEVKEETGCCFSPYFPTIIQQPGSVYISHLFIPSSIHPADGGSKSIEKKNQTF